MTKLKIRWLKWKNVKVKESVLHVYQNLKPWLLGLAPLTLESWDFENYKRKSRCRRFYTVSTNACT